MTRLVSTSLAIFTLLQTVLLAEDVVPGIAGFQRIALPGNSDTVVAVPFARPPAASGAVQSISTNRVTWQGTPGWQAGQFVYASGTQSQTYYLRIVSGTKEGSFFTITANDANSVTVDLEGDTLGDVTTGDQVTIVPHWTLGTLFPNGSGVNASPTPGSRTTEILFPDFNATGVNTSPKRMFYYYSGHWYEVGKGMAAPLDDEILYPDFHFIVRQNTASGSELICPGQVVTGKVLVWLGVNASGPRDNFLALPRPVDGTLGSSGLIASGAFQPSPTPGNRTDTLLVFDNGLVGKNKSPSAIYYYWNNAWRKVGSGTAVFDSAPVFKASAGFILRKAAAGAATPWINTANY